MTINFNLKGSSTRVRVEIIVQEDHPADALSRVHVSRPTKEQLCEIAEVLYDLAERQAEINHDKP